MPKTFRKLLERGARDHDHAIFITSHTVPKSDPLFLNVACSWWYTPSRGRRVTPNWWATKHKILHDLAPVNPTNNAKAAIKIFAFGLGNVRVAPYIRPRDQLVPIKNGESVSAYFKRPWVMGALHSSKLFQEHLATCGQACCLGSGKRL